MPPKTAHVRNSTAEFLIFTAQSGEASIEVRVEGETVWLTQKLMAALFGVGVPTINEHLGNLFDRSEIDRDATIRKFRTVQVEGGRDVARSPAFYNLDAIIAVGFRVNSGRAIQFRQWATGVLRDFAIRGYVLDKERLKNGTFLNEEYFDHLLEEIREIRASERRFYQKITDIYATAMDYSKDAETTQTFFATVQNRLHFAIHGHTAAEVIIERADADKDRMGLATWRNAPNGKILKSDVSVAKNYLQKPELQALERIVTMYLDYAEDQAKRRIPLTMADWATKLNAFLQFNERDILDNPGKVTMTVASLIWPPGWAPNSSSSATGNVASPSLLHSEPSLPGGHRGYIASRPIDGARVPQHIQNLVVREHARRHGLRFLLSATEYTMPECYMMLEQVLEELPRLDGIICYSLFMLPGNAPRRRKILARILDAGKELHAAAEDLILRTPADAAALDDLLTLGAMTSQEGLAETLKKLSAS